MSDLDALREDFNVAHSTGVEIGKSAVAVIRDLQADNERLRAALKMFTAAMQMDVGTPLEDALLEADDVARAALGESK